MRQEKEHYLKSELYSLLRKESTLFDFIEGGSLDGVWYWDLEHPSNEWMSPRFWQLLGYDPATMRHLASEWEGIVFAEDLQSAQENIQKHLQDPSHPYDEIIRFRHRNGSTVWIRCRGMAIRNAQGKATRMFGVHNDITEMMRAIEKIEEQRQKIEALEKKLRDGVTRDALTSLYNRRGMEDHLFKILEYAKREMTPVTLAVVDIDAFKKINDAHGHKSGDAVLKSVATIMLSTLRGSDVICRYSGNTFVAIMPNTPADMSEIGLQRLYDRVKNSTFIHGLKLTLSSGVTTRMPVEDTSHAGMVNLLAEAEKALDYAKAHGKNRIVHFAELALGQDAALIS